MGWTEYRASYFKSGKIDRKAECDAYFLESQAGILGNSITEMKASFIDLKILKEGAGYGKGMQTKRLDG